MTNNTWKKTDNKLNTDNINTLLENEGILCYVFTTIQKLAKATSK